MFEIGTLFYDEGAGVYGIILDISEVDPHRNEISTTVFILATTPDSDFSAGDIEEEFCIDNTIQKIPWVTVKAQYEKST